MYAIHSACELAVITSLVLIALVGLSPLGNALILPLEQRFPPWDASRGPPDGIVVLGGAISPDVSAARGAVALDEAAERITVAAELARRYPNARIVFSGGSNALIFDEGDRGDVCRPAAGGSGCRPRPDHRRGQFAQHHRECGVLAPACRPEAGRALAFGDVGLSHATLNGGVQGGRLCGGAYPVDWRTRGPIDAFGRSSLGDGLQRTDTAVREWVGLLPTGSPARLRSCFRARKGSRRLRQFTDLLRAPR